MLKPLTKSAKAAEEIRDWISQGEYQTGAKLPSILQMSKMLKVADKSAQKAIAQLAAEGLLRRENGVGIFVCEKNKSKRKVLVAIPNPSFLKTNSSYDYLKSEVYSGISSELKKMNAELELYAIYDNLENCSLLDRFNTENCSGIITMGEIHDTLPDEIGACIGSHRVVSTNYAGIPGHRNETLVNIKPGIRAILQKAYDLGHRKFAHLYAENISHQRTQIERFEAFIDFCNEMDIEVPSSCMLKVGKTEMDGYRAANMILDKHPETTLFFAANDRRAEGILQALKDKGITPGKEVSVIGFDDMPDAEKLGLATVSIPRFEIGKIAVRLLEKCKKNKLGHEQVWLESKAVFRSSLGPAQSNNK